MDDLSAVVLLYFVFGLAVGVYSAIRHFKDDTDDWNMLLMFAIAIAMMWPVALYVLVKRRLSSPKTPENVESDAQKTKTLI